MGKYLKLFDNHNGYTAYTADTENFLLPNVSYCIQENECHFKPYSEPSQGLVLSATYSVSSAEPTQLYFYNTDETQGIPIIRGVDMFDKVKIDGSEVGVADIDSDGGMYNLGVGTHTVNYTLKDGVTSVPVGAFVGCSSLTSIIIPSGVTSIEMAAFNGCISLTSIDIPSGVTSIGDLVFAFCESLTSITIPSGVTSIGHYAFEGCSGLTSIDIPSGVTSIGDYAFSHCYSLTSVAIPNYVTSIGDNAFASCSGLTSITIPSGVTSIGDQAFFWCSGLTSITIPSGVTSIGDKAFNGCRSLSAVTCEPTIPPTLGTNAFDYNASGRKIYVPSASVSAYQSASGWSTYASDIEPIGGVPVN